MILHIVPHQHFDIVWRRDHQWYRRRRAELYMQAFELLAGNAQVTFSFSQAYALQEFLASHSEYKEPVRQWLKQGRLEFIGGMLTIADVNLSSLASLIQNIDLGRQWFRDELDYEVAVGAFEDAFGVSAQLPQVLHLAGYQCYKAGRMPRPNRDEPVGNYRWQAQNGSLVRCISNTLCGMSWGWGNRDNPDEPPVTSVAEKCARVKADLVRAIDGAAGFEHALITVMGEEHDILKELPEIVDELNAEYLTRNIRLGFDTYQNYYRQITDQEWEKTPVYAASEDFSRLFTGCYTSRIDSKIRPRQLETRAFAAASPVPHAVWRNLALMQFHDAIAGCHVTENAQFLAGLYDESCRELATGDYRIFWDRVLPDFPAQTVSESALPAEFGDWSFAQNGENVAMAYRGCPIPDIGVVAREESGTLWTEEYSDRRTDFSGCERLTRVCRGGSKLCLQFAAEERNFRLFWPGFSRIVYRKTLTFLPDSAWVKVDLDLDFLGNSTEIAVRIAGDRPLTEGLAEIPGGTVRRTGYSRQLVCGDAFPALNFVQFDRYVWCNAGTPSHAFRGEGLENIILRSPVKRWAPWFPVTPTDDMWDNGPRKYHFIFCADNRNLSRCDLHKAGIEFNLMTQGISFDVQPLDLPANLMAAAVTEEAVYVYETEGRPAVWRGQTFGPLEISKVMTR